MWRSPPLGGGTPGRSLGEGECGVRIMSAGRAESSARPALPCVPGRRPTGGVSGLRPGGFYLSPLSTEDISVPVSPDISQIIAPSRFLDLIQALFLPIDQVSSNDHHWPLAPV
ncbi:hypothetical protein M2266_004932 [Streptomyces sp. SPB162]|nr:hypothetical protein [Streptomyces sp. SPB162]